MTTYHALLGFQRDLLEAIAALENDPYGLVLKAYLDERYAEPINHSRLYQNLGTIAEQDLINRDELDARTNVDLLTDAGRHLVRRQADTLPNLCDLPRLVVEGGAQ
ncbi:DNA-binding protein (plasmid) [Haloarcula sp. CBA1115]|uniref:helix-turn-helix transcriptional regulator n=1 Tax=unclassified Haloarcula TaxID=2624677 RepID=UPI000595598B|nr:MULTISPECIES: helix-turn-helix transcriptional regulator [unclassified Haloarcula]AJF28071.1 DNA-binding protein [Haloarcula sp. CBA1115]